MSTPVDQREGSPRDTPGGGPQYEFGPADDVVIGGLGSRMRFVGFSSVLIGVVLVLFGILSVARRGTSPTLVVVLGAGAYLATVGIWTGRAGLAFRRIDETRGRDVTHLMAALTRLDALYAFQYWIVLIGLIFFVAAIVFGFWAEDAR